MTTRQQLVAERKVLSAIYQASGVVDSNVLELLKDAGFNEAVKAHGEQKIGRAYFDAIYYCRDRASEITAQLKTIPWTSR